MKIEVCILAGGKSSRMGRAKPNVELAGATLLDWSRRIARGAGFSSRVIDRDLGDSIGPVSGIQTALKTTRADAVIFLSCDMPFVRSSTLQKLAGTEAATFARLEGLAGFPFLLRKKDTARGASLQEVARNLKARYLEIALDEAFNINTPAELNAAAKRFAEFSRDVVLDIDGMTMRRGPVEILRGVNWQVKQGEHWAILGANGSGKTSLLSALTAYASATTGRVRLLGQEWGRADWRALRKHIGIVSSTLRQLTADGETALETVASGREAMIDVWGPLKRVDATRARAILADLGIEYLEKRVWAVLSQGERQRVLIGRAMMAAPKALILDEPCAGLDPAARERFLEFVQALTQSKRAPAIILVTHHVEEIVPGITHVLALKNGAVLEAGEKKETLRSRLMSDLFDCEASLKRAAGRYSLAIKSEDALKFP